MGSRSRNGRETFTPAPPAGADQDKGAEQSLTVTAVKDSGEWNLEAGALVLADAGLCCIDEFNSLKEHDRTSIHEAMEQQTISVAKAGLVCKLNTRTTILAATNPKGQYDPQESVSVNIALGSPLLSRFDLILVLLDTRNEDWDRIISSFILENKGYPSTSGNLWSMEKMKSYFCLVRTLQPTLSDVSNQVLLRYYQMQRQSDSRSAARTTIRLLESLIRLAEAHARLMFRSTVTLEDAITVVSVMESSMQGGALLGGVNVLHTSFPESPQAQYRRQCELILEKLELPSLLSEELRRLERLQNESVRQLQPQSVEVEVDTGSLRNDSGDKPRLRTSTQQEQSCSWYTSSPSGGPNVDSPPGLGPNRSTSSNLSAKHNGASDDSVDCFDLVTTPESEPESRVVSPELKTAEENVVLKIPNNKSQDSEIHGPGHRSKLLETGHLPSLGPKDAPLRLHTVESAKASKAADVSEGAGQGDEPDSELTSVPHKLPKLQKDGPQSLRKSTTRVRSLPPTVPFSKSTSLPGPEKTTGTFKRKRQESPAQVLGPEPEGVENAQTPLVKLAKFTFKRKTKLSHSEGLSLIPSSSPKIAVSSPKIPQQRTRGEAAVSVHDPEKLTSTSGDRCSDQLQGKTKELSRQPLERDEAGEEREQGPERRPIQLESELGSQSGHSHLAREKDRKERASCSHKTSKVHAGTLARLANFSFTSPPESQSESLPPERKRPGERRQSPPASAAGLGQQRQSFQLQPATERANLSTHSLFTLSELDDETLDFDWDEEIRKKT
ncbi:DNA helicase MCM9 isoform X1 [Sigmodon hispidus]